MQQVNTFIPEGQSEIKEGPNVGKRLITYKVIRPDSEIVLEIDEFTPKEIRDLIDLGQRTAKKASWSTGENVS